MRLDSPARAASHVRNEGLNYQAVVLADSADAPSWTIEIQKGLRIDSQDREDGLDTYCVVLSGGASSYGGLKEARLTEGDLRVDLLDHTQRELGLRDSWIAVPLDLPDSVTHEVAHGLRAILAGDRLAPALRGILAQAES